MKYQEYNTNGHGRGRGPDEIDSDLHAIRSEMSETLHLLEDKFSPRAVIEQLFSGARSGVRGASQGSSEFVGNLGATLRDNPIPILLLASGVLSLLAAERTGGGRSGRLRSIPGERTMAGDIAEMAHAVDDAHSVKSRAREVAGSVGERARNIRERASEIRGRAGERASEFGERAGEFRAHAQETSAAARERVRGAVQQTRERGSRTLQDEPLVIVGLGLAIGAIFGATMPVSERERRMLGREGENLIRRGEGAIGRAKEAVQAGVERATDVATQERAQQRSQQPQQPEQPSQQPQTPSRPQTSSLQGQGSTPSVEGAPVVIVSSSSSASVRDREEREIEESETEKSSGDAKETLGDL
jgi:hypothetical protein